MTTRHRLILHADDFGMSEAVTEGILQSFVQGSLTSTSVLANGPDFARAMVAWKTLALGGRGYDLGVHLNLTQGRPLSGERYPAALLDRQGRFPGIAGLFLRLLRPSETALAAIREELRAQFERVAATGVGITHLNGHQYIELLPPVREAVVELAAQHHISVVRCAQERGLATTMRAASPATRLLAYVKRHYGRRFSQRLRRSPLCAPDRFFGTAHAGRIDRTLVEQFLKVAQYDSGDKSLAVEIGLHPGLPRPASTAQERADGWTDPLADHRPHEWRLLCDSRLPELIGKAGFALGRLRDLPSASAAQAVA
jgi:predicted glycoside hydrolase/deacetylase ChbG (UPF0249 family)